MNICRLHGEELQKSQSNTFEDYFNRSEVTYRDGGEERTLSVLYLRHFEAALLDWLPYESDPLFTANGRDIRLRDIIAFVCLWKNPAYRKRKRVYIHDEEELRRYFAALDTEALEALVGEWAKPAHAAYQSARRSETKAVCSVLGGAGKTAIRARKSGSFGRTAFFLMDYCVRGLVGSQAGAFTSPVVSASFCK